MPKLEKALKSIRTLIDLGEQHLGENEGWHRLIASIYFDAAASCLTEVSSVLGGRTR